MLPFLCLGFGDGRWIFGRFMGPMISLLIQMEISDNVIPLLHNEEVSLVLCNKLERVS